jgi:hypothetical protein
MKIEQVGKPVFQIGHALTTLGMMAAFAGWVIAADKEQVKDLSETRQEVTEVRTRQEMIISQQQEIKTNQMKAIEILNQIRGQLGGN